MFLIAFFFFFFFQAEDGIRDTSVTGVQTCALPICAAGVDLRAERRLEARGGLHCGDQRLVEPLGCGEHARQLMRSEERRVGKECRTRWGADHENNKYTL